MPCQLEGLPSKFSRTSLAASTLAGLSVFGRSEESREITLKSWKKGEVESRVQRVDTEA